MSENAIEVKNLKKSFLLPHQKNNSIKSRFISPFSKYDNEKQVAFKDVSFEVKKGEFFGIVGRNGSGKSTLLKCLAGVYNPDHGSINIEGKLVPFIELGVGFNPELSGRDNVFLNGALLGFNRREIAAMYDEIVEFAELEKFMDQKLKNYSSGMQVRLAFSIAIKAQGDILLLDEVLAVGDAAFQQKCYDYFSDLKSSDKTIILVSHNMQAVERYCDRAILINNGEIKAIGNSSDIGIMYEDMFIDEEAERLAAERKKGQNNSVDVSDRKVSVEAVIVKQNEKITKKIKQGIDFSIEVTVEASEDVFNTDVGITIKDKDRFMLFDGSIAKSKGSIKLAKGEKYTVIFDLNNIFKRGLYVINVGVAEISKPEKPKMYARVEKAAEFSVSGESTRATISIPYFVNGKKADK